MWTDPVTILDGEDEETLIKRFVELSAAYPTYSIFEIAQETFRGLPDAELRSGQAAIAWGNSLAIKERIRKRKRGEVEEVEEYTKEDWLAEILAVTRDTLLTANAKKVMLDGLNSYGDGKGWRHKPADAGRDDSKRRLPNITFIEIQE
jgi:hypothetical protein